MKALALLILLLIPALAHAQSHEDAWARHWQARDFVVASQGSQTRAGGVLLLGDSITEGNAITELCGLPVVNGGLGGATALDVAMHAQQYVADTRPQIVVLMVGTNDAILPHWIDTLDKFEAWRQYHAGSVVAARTAGAKVILVTIPPGPGVHEGMRQWLNSAVAYLGQAWGLTVVNPWASPQTTDGIHLAASGYTDLNMALEGACRR